MTKQDAALDAAEVVATGHGASLADTLSAVAATSAVVSNTAARERE